MINEANLIGRIGKKDSRQLKTGAEMVTLSIATNRKWTDKGGLPQEQTTWHTVNCFNKLAEITKKYAHVGSLVYIKGEINHKEISQGERQGQLAYSVTAQQFKILSSGPKKDVAPTDGNKKPIDPHDFSEELDDEIPF